MQQYLDLVAKVLAQGVPKTDRTHTGTISLFGTQTRYPLSENHFPLLTTKKVHWTSIVHELLWFIKGDTNIKYLVDHGVRIWNEWPYAAFKASSAFQGESLSAFVDRIKQDADFAQKWGNLGPVYGQQWRNFHGVDQLAKVVKQLKETPDSRRIIISAWDPSSIKDMALPPCHAFIQFYVNNNTLSCQLYQRSADIFLGVPFNITSYALLTMMLAQVTNLKLGEFIHTIGDAHIYTNHLEQVKLQLQRKPKPLPQVKLNPQIKNIEDFTFDDITLLNYDPHPLIKGKVAV